MRFNKLDDWLSWQETLNPADIDLGLDRLQQVMQQAAIADRFDCPLIMVAGTNGKGSTIAFIEAIASAAGYRVCCYSSPHIQRYNERIRIAGANVTDEALCSAFQRVDDARGELPLTYFEFGTLAAIDLFQRSVEAGDADLVVMEIGLGGRLDAVNVMQPDVSIITSIALDHTDWLGDTRELIAVEKAGVMRAQCTTVIGDWVPPASLDAVAQEVGARTLGLGRGIFIAVGEDEWSLQTGEQNLFGLPHPALAGEHQYANASCAITALLGLADRLPLERTAIDAGLVSARIVGRLQRLELDDGTEVILDVAHNVDAIAVLVQWCQQHPVEGATRVVLAMLRDKPVEQVAGQLSGISNDFFISGLPGVERALSEDELEDRLGSIARDGKLISSESVQQACECAQRSVDNEQGGRIVVTGSFYTVAEAIRYFEQLI